MTEKYYGNRDQCEECKSFNTERDEIRCEIYCRDCGLTADLYISNTCKFNAKYDDNGVPEIESRRKGDLGSTIGGNVKGMSEDTRRTYGRMRTIQARMANSGQRTYYEAKERLDRMDATAEIPAGIKARALEIYEQASKAGITHGKPLELTMTAAMYQAYRENNGAKSYSSLARSYGLDSTELCRHWKRMVGSLGLRKTSSGADGYTIEILSNLKYGNEASARVRSYAKTINGSKAASGISPKSIAAACAMKVNDEMGLGYSQKDVAKASGVSAPTIKRVTELIEKELGEGKH